jgi:hypothetical protein
VVVVVDFGGKGSQGSGKGSRKGSRKGSTTRCVSAMHVIAMGSREGASVHVDAIRCCSRRLPL